MFHSREIAEAFSDDILLDSGDVRCNSGSQTIVDIVLSCKAQLFLLHIEGGGNLYFVHSVFNVCDGTLFLDLGERKLYGLNFELFKFFPDDRIIVPIDKMVF